MKKAGLLIPAIVLVFASISCERNKSMSSAMDIAESEVLGLTLAEASAEEDHSVSMESPGTFRMFGMMGPGKGVGKGSGRQCPCRGFCSDFFHIQG